MTDQIIDLCYTLHMMGVPLDYHSYAFRENHAIIQQSNIPESKLTKHWNTVAFHHVREALTSGFLQLYHILRNENHTNILMKFLRYQEAIQYLCPLLFWHGDTSDIPKKGSVN